jgi:hypothetical protein
VAGGAASYSGERSTTSDERWVEIACRRLDRRDFRPPRQRDEERGEDEQRDN